MSDYTVKRITQVVDWTGFTVAHIHCAKYCMTEAYIHCAKYRYCMTESLTSKGMSKPIPIIE